MRRDTVEIEAPAIGTAGAAIADDQSAAAGVPFRAAHHLPPFS